MRVYLEAKDAYEDVPSCTTGKELLAYLDLSPSSVILTKNGKVILSDASLEENDEIKILEVISGG